MKQTGQDGALLSSLIACSALAQVPADQLKGTWSGVTNLCGPSKLNFVSVEANGIVQGTFECPKRNIVFVLGEKTEFNKSMAATLRGQKLDIVGANDTGFQFVLNGKELNGFGLGGPGTKNPMTF